MWHSEDAGDRRKAMTDKEQREYNRAKRDVADALEKLEKMYGVAMLRRILENQDKRDLRPKHLAIMLDEERQKDI